MKAFKHKITIFNLLLIIIIPLCTFAQLPVELDYATFRYNDSESLTEIYYSVPIASLKFVPITSGKIQAQVMIRLTISENGNIWKDESWKMERVLNDTTEINLTNRMVDVMRFSMKPGTYKMELYAEDLNNSSNSSSLEKMMDVNNFINDHLLLSDVQLASSIKRADFDSTNIFWKNGLEIIPNPGALYAKQNPVLFYYLESYNSDLSMEGDTYKHHVKIMDSNDQELDNIKTRDQEKKIHNSNIELGTINLYSLATGVYNLEIGIYDIQDNLQKSITKKFYYYNPDDLGNTDLIAMEDVEAAVLKSEFAEMNEKELDKEFQITRYFTTKEERDFYKKLESVDAKKRYIYKIWKKRDINPLTETNEYKIEYRRRIEDANKKYRSYTRPGWITDRGRVYILFGPPTDVERNPNNPISYAHEIWHYDNIEGGIIYVFVDTQEYGEYTQIHSTKRGEPMNNDWESVIAK